MADEATPRIRPRRPCPVCGKLLERSDPEGRFRPFCSARCRQVDLGRWLAEDYAVPGPPADRPDEEEIH
ncbi:DNA gyrase inhibitor YacG [Siccirubricoccus deserti]|uniref:DNA gyrase inhibitor YacG n=1 Tax=Siccirubricoccus deserti TaxID=2013562 RepID=A0A9X0UFC2_9PROT|nr:DNA gyrase inhibitor YacG [Siccirubricoccus deserti]MBC4017713.1 DNA gyrase inhibitor YacG [Siccirubricoccus deserti]GGC40262.1 DNA gyrase inhibitor YacG [Siccirubricoccus deserti]